MGLWYIQALLGHHSSEEIWGLISENFVICSCTKKILTASRLHSIKHLLSVHTSLCCVGQIAWRSMQAKKREMQTQPNKYKFVLLRKLDKMKKNLRIIDLFAGIGGIRLGFEEYGCENVFSSEWDK